MTDYLIRPAIQQALEAAAIDADGKQWIQVMPVATEAVNGPWKFTITSEDLQAAAEFIQANGGKIPVDYDHPGQDGSTRAAGWFTGQARVVNDVLEAEVEWTPKAQQEIKDGEYRFVSPEWQMHDKDSKTGVLTRFKEMVATTLTNRPFFKELAPLTASEAIAFLSNLSDEDQAALREELLKRAPAQITTEGDDMSFKVIATALGLAEDADEDAITAALKDRDDRIKALEEENKTAKEAAKIDPDTLATLTASAAKGEAAAARLRELEVDTMLKDAVKDGKLLPVQVEGDDGLKAQALKSDESFELVKAMVAKIPEGTIRHKAVGDEKAAESPDASDAKVLEYTDPDTDSKVVARRVDPTWLDNRAKAILAEAGKADAYTADEYLAASRRAQNEALTAQN